VWLSAPRKRRCLIETGGESGEQIPGAWQTQRLMGESQSDEPRDGQVEKSDESRGATNREGEESSSVTNRESEDSSSATNRKGEESGSATS